MHGAFLHKIALLCLPLTSTPFRRMGDVRSVFPFTGAPGYRPPERRTAWTRRCSYPIWEWYEKSKRIEIPEANVK